MKNVFKNALLILSLSTGYWMEAAEDLNVKVLDSQNVKVELKNGDKGDVLLLKDIYGNVLYQDSLNLVNSYEKTFNLELVPKGIYYLSLDQKGSLLVTTIRKTEKGLEVDGFSDFTFKPCFETKSKEVRMFLNNPGELKTTLKVYDPFGILVGKMESKELVVKRTLDFSQVPSGNYIVEVEIDDQKFTNELEIK